MAVEHRAKLVGHANAHDARAATAYGRLFLAGMLGHGDDAARLYAAAEQIERIWRTWDSMAGIKRMDPGAPSAGSELDPELWRRYQALNASMRRAIGPGLAMTLVEAVCIQHIEPPRLISDHGYVKPGSARYCQLTQRLHEGLLQALDRVADMMRGDTLDTGRNICYARNIA
jgi:hypothetical protein